MSSQGQPKAVAGTIRDVNRQRILAVLHELRAARYSAGSR
jgi:hypothetical protein